MEIVMREPVLRVVRLSASATLPTRGSALAAGCDLYSAHDCTVPARGRAVVFTDIQVGVPHGCYGRVAPRSGLAVSRFVDVGAGVIDADYRGNVGVLLFNFGAEDFQVRRGDRVAQLICERVALPSVREVARLDSTGRGAEGFGSTGLGEPTGAQPKA
ncbi:dUTPase-like protein [Seal parapoxvirus]|uniref:Deoxyuridine 5'-triphosphate nucleotidohydrolase n=1 Tax=Seal parapoxvirus TaxID=187984 RepID=A0A1Z3GCM5_9POXV|nr:dUTPase [Seal parapoxvirus]YP_009389416.1 dUTPase [Seal parapoxvirus]ASC55519.1 dUTPase-like protein [Seal parapoxvirus]ASC55624.1 dUTPase-like protein [Seal parapoxvirus]